MRKRSILAGMLAICLTLSLALPCQAAGRAAALDDAVQAVNALGILSGDATGDLALTRLVTRAEFIAMAIKASPGGAGVGKAGTSPYPDVPRSHWASGYVEAAVARGLVSGFSDGTFRPNQNVKLAEGVTIVLALLGYGTEDFSGAYPTGQLAMYQNLKLNLGVSVSDATASLTRQDAAYLFYNMLAAKTKEGTPYLQLLGYDLDAAGKPDLVSLVNGQMEGPVVVQSGWQSTLGFAPTKVYRNGNLTTLSAVQDYDILYWNDAMDTVWAYSKKVTGSIQALEPSSAAPTAVTVAGRTYAIESSTAAYALSDLGTYALGDNVTLLLGRSGGVAAVAEIAASAGERIGLVLEVSSGSYPDGNGGNYTAQTVTLLATDGQTYQYQTRGVGSSTAGSLARVSVSPQGNEVTLKTLASSSLSGKVNTAGTKLGQYAFAQNVEILDVGGKHGAVVYPGRLAGLSLSGSQVRYYALNTHGEIETLILNNVTGDMYQYGVLTRLEDQGSGFSQMSSYEFDVGGQHYAIPGSTTRYPVSVGPILVSGDPNAPELLRSLTAAGNGTLSGNQFVSGAQKYTLSDNVAVYEFRSGSYYWSSLSRAEQSGGTLTAWYDKAESSGGRIRVLVMR